MDRPPAPPDDLGGDPALHPVRVLVEEHLALASSTWTVGPPGAVARFVRDADELARRGPHSVVTARAGLRVLLPDEAVAIAYETPSARDPLRWHHAVAFCVPDAVAARSGRTVVTELGPDRDALRPQDTGSVLFDLGLGHPAADVLVRTTDDAALTVLRAAVGRDLLDPDVGLTAALGPMAPHVVVLTAAARMEILATGPEPGPHLRMRPAKAREGGPPPGHVPIPAGWTPVLRLHPAHPAHPAGGPDGLPPFDAERHLAFQALLAEHGDPVLGVIVADVTDAVRANRLPESVRLPDGPVTRAAVSVALRRLALTDGTSGALAAWRSRYGPADELADPDDD